MTKKILVVDDEPDVLKLVSFRLRKAGYEVMTVEDPKTALDILRSSAGFDLIILDIIMPAMDGYELTQVIKEDSNLKNIHILYLTASFNACDISKQEREFKVDGCLTKPFDPQELLELVEKIVG